MGVFWFLFFVPLIPSSEACENLAVASETTKLSVHLHMDRSVEVNFHGSHLLVKVCL